MDVCRKTVADQSRVQKIPKEMDLQVAAGLANSEHRCMLLNKGPTFRQEKHYWFLEQQVELV